MTLRMNFSPVRVWRRGPTWFSQTWWGGDSLAARQYSLLRLLALAHREQLDVVPLIASLAMEHRHFYRHVLTTLAARIEAGATLIAALEQTPDALGDDDVIALRLAGESGTWSQTFSELLKRRMEDQRAARLRPKFSAGYWLIILLMTYLLLNVLMHIVVPTFKKLGEEMNLVPPRAFVRLIRFADPVNLGWIMLATIVLVLWFTWFRTPRRFLERQVAPKLLPPVAQRQIVELIRMLAVVVEAGRPIAGALSTLARHHFSRRLRYRLLFARNEVEQGANVWHGLAQSRVIDSAEAEALSKSPNSRVTAWTLRELAQQKSTEASQRTAALATFIEPALTVLFGALVLWVCYAFFQYLVVFISQV